MDTAEHWEQVYASKAVNEVSWFRPHLETSLARIERAANDLSASIIDVGGGASTLVDDLAAKGYRNITVLDVSPAALHIAQERLGKAAERIVWLAEDVTRAAFAPQSYDVWHDRAVFHFLTEPTQRAAYVRNIIRAVKPHGHVIVGAFGLEGPRKCSGLDVVRYNADSLHAEFGPEFHLVEAVPERHVTPFGTTQQFQYCHFTLENA